MNGIVTSGLLAVGLVTVRDVKEKRLITGYFPPPGDYLDLIVIFGGLSLIGSYQPAYKLALLFAIALDIKLAMDIIK